MERLVVANERSRTNTNCMRYFLFKKSPIESIHNTHELVFIKLNRKHTHDTYFCLTFGSYAFIEDVSGFKRE